MAGPEPRPYHHGDLRRALIEAARRILEREGGPSALSLRAVAREAGVSPAAPYHHFKDKDELMGAVARQGFDALAETMRKAGEAASPETKLNALGVAYVCFARDNPALYHVMYDSGRKRDFRSKDAPREESGAFRMVREAMVHSQAASTSDPLDFQLAAIAGWCASHGLAEMAYAREFDDLKAQLGGDEAFFGAVLGRLHMLKTR